MRRELDFESVFLFCVQPGAGGLVRDPEMDEDEDAAEADRKLHEEDGNEGRDIDPAALAYIRSRKNVHQLAAARKNL